MDNKNLILRLDLAGEIKAIDLQEGITIPFAIHNNVIQYLHPDSYHRFFQYLKESNQIGYSLGGELVFQHRLDYQMLSISMIRYDEDVLLLNLNEPQKTLKVLDEIIKINNEITTEIRKSYQSSQRDSQLDTSLLEISSLNSELINTQRELAKKNAQLEQANLILERMSMQDYLTEIPNRRKFFHDIYEVVLHEAYYLVMIDFNNFKKVNDSKGHEYGDYVLKSFSASLKSMVNPLRGITYRLGGDEFALLVPEQSQPDFQSMIMKLNQLLKGFHPELSIAYGFQRIDHACINVQAKAETIMAQVDQQMYQNKAIVKSKP